MKRITILSLFFLHVVLDDRLAFVYELVRHGARAPLIDEPEGFFHVKAGILTESGMRERFLLGTYNKQRFIDKY